MSGPAEQHADPNKAPEAESTGSSTTTSKKRVLPAFMAHDVERARRLKKARGGKIVLPTPEALKMSAGDFHLSRRVLNAIGTLDPDTPHTPDSAFFPAGTATWVDGRPRWNIPSNGYSAPGVVLGATEIFRATFPDNLHRDDEIQAFGVDPNVDITHPLDKAYTHALVVLTREQRESVWAMTNRARPVPVDPCSPYSIVSVATDGDYVEVVIPTHLRFLRRSTYFLQLLPNTGERIDLMMAMAPAVALSMAAFAEEVRYKFEGGPHKKDICHIPKDVECTCILDYYRSIFAESYDRTVEGDRIVRVDLGVTLSDTPGFDMIVATACRHD
jgi:hypothetical protein